MIVTMAMQNNSSARRQTNGGKQKQSDDEMNNNSYTEKQDIYDINPVSSQNGQ